MHEPRTEPASPRKLARARRAGSVARSADLIAAAALLALAGVVAWSGSRMLHALRALLQQALAAPAAPVPPALASSFAPALEVAWLTLVALLAIAGATALAGFVQVGPLWSSAAIAPDLRRLDPGARLRAMFSAERWVDPLLGLLKWLVLAMIAGFTLLRGTRALSSIPTADAPYALSVLTRLAFELLLRVGIAAVLLGSADLVYRWLQWRRQLRMGRHELRMEQREQYGQPEQRQARARLWRAAFAHNAALAIEDAAVLLVDAGGRALALAYDRDDAAQHAPRVLLKAQDALAAQLKLDAQRRALPVRFAPGLVSALFPLEISEEIPRAQHAAVAELLAEVLHHE
jgi:flagellar biosynthetic protein FlhB